MSKTLQINKIINSFNHTISVDGDKSLSIRWVLMASQAKGVSKAYNLLMSEDVKAALNTIKKLGIKFRLHKDCCKIFGKGINSYEYKKI
jgi:3-phosphoshikimate 1-carboxyvinyltransferase